MNHFFPIRELQRSDASRQWGTLEKIDIGETLFVPDGRPTGRQFRPKAIFSAIGRGVSPGLVVNAADAIGGAATAAAAPVTQGVARLRGFVRSNLSSAVTSVSRRRNGGRGDEADEDPHGACTSFEMGAESAPGAPLEQVRKGKVALAIDENSFGAADTGQPGDTRLPSPRGRAAERGEGPRDYALRPHTPRRGKTQKPAGPDETPAGPCKDGEVERVDRSSAQDPGLQRAPNASLSYTIGDNLSTADYRFRGHLIVYIPRAPKAGAWAASVTFDPARNVGWVLAEALRMYEREHKPLRRHSGLARKSQLVRGAGRWGPMRRDRWVRSHALPEDATLQSVLAPGDEVVVLVEGLDPALAFRPQESFSIASSIAPLALSMDGESRSTVSQGFSTPPQVAPGKAGSVHDHGSLPGYGEKDGAPRNRKRTWVSRSTWSGEPKRRYDSGGRNRPGSKVAGDRPQLSGSSGGSSSSSDEKASHDREGSAHAERTPYWGTRSLGDGDDGESEEDKRMPHQQRAKYSWRQGKKLHEHARPRLGKAIHHRATPRYQAERGHPDHGVFGGEGTIVEEDDKDGDVGGS